MPAFVIALVLAVTTALGGGAAYASQDSIPTDALYQVKTALETVQLVLATNDEAKAQTYLELAEKRLSEIQKAAQAGNADAANAAANALAVDITQAEQHLDQAATSGQDVSRVAAQLAENLARQQKQLASVAAQVPDAAGGALAQALQTAGKGLTKAAQHFGVNPVAQSLGDTATSTPTSTPTASATGEPTGTPVSTATATVTATVVGDLDKMKSDVEKLAHDTDARGDSYKGLLAKLDAARAAVDRGQVQVAMNNLDAFLDQLNAFQRSGHISAADYDTLYASYSALVTALGGTPRAGRTPEPTGTPEATSEANGHSGRTPEATHESRGREGRDAEPTAQPTQVAPSATPDPVADPTHPSRDRQGEDGAPTLQPTPHADPTARGGRER